MYPAKNGDAFLADFGGTYLLIDAGFASTYQDFVAPDLAQLAKEGGRLDLVVCTHIDADHIGGLLEFFSCNGTPAKRGIEVDAVWHNSLRSLPSPTAEPDGFHDRMVLEAIRRRGFQGAPTSSPTRHGHPDFEVLAEIVDRPAPFKRHLFFNYETAASKQLESHTSKSGTAFSVHVAENDWIQVGENNYD